MTDACSCTAPGFCDRRQCLISGLHFRRCQAGQVAILDSLYANKLEPVLPRKQSDMVLPSGGRSLSERRSPCNRTVQAIRHGELVGSALKNRIESLITIKTGTGCGCQNLATQMDAWGIAGCERRREEIIGHLIANREILTEALKVNGNWLLSAAAGMAPDALLHAGAAWLFAQAINDARTQPKPARVIRPRTTTGKAPPAGRDILPAIMPRPFTAKPRLTLLCHCWPNGDGWRRHADYLKPVDDVFHRKIMGVATGPGTATFDEVRAAFGDSWEYFEVRNDPTLREVLTYRMMLPMVHTTDENDVTFCIHTKGTQSHTANSDQIKWWTEAMYSTVVYNWKKVLANMAQGYPIVGSFIRNGKHLKARYEWHYSGTFYAFRNAATFMNGIPQFDHHWYGTESWPGHHFARHEAACMFAENCGDIYKVNHDLEQSLNEWRQANAVVSR